MTACSTATVGRNTGWGDVATTPSEVLTRAADGGAGEAGYPDGIHRAKLNLWMVKIFQKIKSLPELGVVSKLVKITCDFIFCCEHILLFLYVFKV